MWNRRMVITVLWTKSNSSQHQRLRTDTQRFGEKKHCIENHRSMEIFLTDLTVFMQEELLEIKELPVSNERPECLSVKYDR